MQQVLVIANQTAVGSHLTHRLHDIKGDAAELAVHIVVPATPRRSKQSPRSDGSGRPIHDADGIERADRQLRAAIEAIEKIGATVTGSVGPADPLRAADIAAKGRRIDRIVVSTLPAGVSRWLAMDLPHRLERRFKVPVDHIVGKPSEEEVPRPPLDRPVSILLVEDQPADIALTRQAFGRTGVDVDVMVAKNGAEAIEALKTYGQNAIDLVLLDLKMPVVDGHEFLEQAGDLIDLDALEVVVLTTSTNDSDRERAHALGASAYVVKDPDFDVFAETIESVVGAVVAR